MQQHRRKRSQIVEDQTFIVKADSLLEHLIFFYFFPWFYNLLDYYFFNFQIPLKASLISHSFLILLHWFPTKKRKYWLKSFTPCAFIIDSFDQIMSTLIYLFLCFIISSCSLMPFMYFSPSSCNLDCFFRVISKITSSFGISKPPSFLQSEK